MKSLSGTFFGSNEGVTAEDDRSSSIANSTQRDHAPLPHRLMAVEGKVITPPQSLGSTNLPHEPSVHDIIDCKLITLSPISTTNNIPLY